MMGYNEFHLFTYKEMNDIYPKIFMSLIRPLFSTNYSMHEMDMHSYKA